MPCAASACLCMPLFPRSCNWLLSGFCICQTPRPTFSKTCATCVQVRQLRATQRLPLRNQSFNGKFSIPTFAEYLDIALQAGRPLGVYPGGCCRCDHCQGVVACKARALLLVMPGCVLAALKMADRP